MRTFTPWLAVVAIPHVVACGDARDVGADSDSPRGDPAPAVGGAATDIGEEKS